MTRIIALVFLSCVLGAVEIPPIERSFRFLVVGEDGKPADGVPFHWNSEMEDGLNAYGGRQGKNVARKVLLSANGGVVDIPKHQFSTISVAINAGEVKKSSVWMVDSKTSSQSFYWDVYDIDNPQAYALGPPTPGFDAVFKVLSKKGISDLIRYNVSHKQVPCDGTPTPLRVLGGPAQVKNPADADVVITIKRPDQELKPKDAPGVGLVLPQRVPWTLQGRTLRFAHFATDTELSADYHIRAWTDTIVVEPSNVDTSYGTHSIILWALLPGETPTVFPMRCTIRASYDSKQLGKLVYWVEFEVLLPIAPCTRFHPDLRMESWSSLSPELSPAAIPPQFDPIRRKNVTHAVPADLTTVPRLHYDTYPIPPGKDRKAGAPPVLLPPDKP